MQLYEKINNALGGQEKDGNNSACVGLGIHGQQNPRTLPELFIECSFWTSNDAVRDSFLTAAH